MKRQTEESEGRGEWGEKRGRGKRNEQKREERGVGRGRMRKKDRRLPACAAIVSSIDGGSLGQEAQQGVHRWTISRYDERWQDEVGN